MKSWIRVVAVFFVIAFAAAPVSSAAPPPSPIIECPDHTHVWNRDQCEDNPYSLPGGGGGPSQCGGLCGILRRVLGGLGGLLGMGPAVVVWVSVAS